MNSISLPNRLLFMFCILEYVPVSDFDIVWLRLIHDSLRKTDYNSFRTIPDSSRHQQILGRDKRSVFGTRHFYSQRGEIG